MPLYSYNGKVSIQCHTATISSGQTTSGSVSLEGHGLVGIEIPSAFTGTSITFKGSTDNSTFVDLYNTDGTQLSVTVSTSRLILLSPGDLVGVPYIKLVSGSSEGADRTLCLVLRGFV